NRLQGLHVRLVLALLEPFERALAHDVLARPFDLVQKVFPSRTAESFHAHLQKKLAAGPAVSDVYAELRPEVIRSLPLPCRFVSTAAAAPMPRGVRACPRGGSAPCSLRFRRVVKCARCALNDPSLTCDAVLKAPDLGRAPR